MLPKKSIGNREIELNLRKNVRTFPQTIESMLHDSQTVATLSDNFDLPSKRQDTNNYW